jgi:hypothetical protein
MQTVVIERHLLDAERLPPDQLKAIAAIHATSLQRQACRIGGSPAMLRA